MKNIHFSASLLIVIAAVLWALDGIIRRSLYTLAPVIIVFYEHLIGAIILLPFLIKGFSKERVTKREIFIISIVSLLSGLLGTLWFTTALVEVHFISFSVVFLLQKLQPIFAISAGAIFLKEKVDRRYIKWAALAIVAAYFVTFNNGYVNLQTGQGTIIAALYALGAAFAWGSSTAFSRMVLLKNSHVVTTGLRFVITTIFAFFAVFLFGQGTKFASPDFSQFLRFVIIALSTGMVALLIYYKGLAKTEVKVSTILELTFPILAIFIDAFMYKTILSPTQYLAAAILMFAMFRIAKLQQAKKPQKSVAKEKVTPAVVPSQD
ncbi:MAG: DMT family transporter [Candidatus Levybacteria bacterium]|nr:DMT family transporter [Candidatus Levybacteria bacterium]